MKKLISWNVNGLRACVNKGFEDFFREIGADVFVGVERIDRLDKPYRGYRYQIVLLVLLAVILLYYVRHKPQVVLNKNVARVSVAVFHSKQVLAFLFFRQRLRERAASADMKHKKADVLPKQIYSAHLRIMRFSDIIVMKGMIL